MRHFAILPFFPIFLTLAACTQSADLGANRPTPTSTRDSGTGRDPAVAPAPATTGLSLAHLGADAVPNDDLVGVAFTHASASGARAVSFVIVDHAGNAKSDVIALGDGASEDAGVAVTVDPAAHSFYAAWVESVEGASPARLHLHAIGEDGHASALPPVTMEKSGNVTGIDVFPSLGALLVSGFIGQSDLFLAPVNLASGTASPFVWRSQPGASSPRTRFQGARGDCSAAEGCMIALRDAAGAHPRFGMYGSPAIGVSVGVSQSLNDTGAVTATNYFFGAAHEAEQGPASPRVAAIDFKLVSIGVSETGDVRLQGDGRDCGTISPRGCEAPTEQSWRNDFTAGSIGGDASMSPAAIALDDHQAAFALTHGGAGEELVFGTSPLPWASPGSPKPALSHTLSAGLDADPILVKTSAGWVGLWIEAGELFVAPF